MSASNFYRLNVGEGDELVFNVELMLGSRGDAKQLFGVENRNGDRRHLTHVHLHINLVRASFVDELSTFNARG